MSDRPYKIRKITELPDITVKSIIRDRATGFSYRALERKYGMDHATCKRICDADIFGDETRKAKEKILKQAQKNTEDVINHMAAKQDDVIVLIDKLLKAMDNEEKISNTNLTSLATTMGIVLDKYLQMRPPEQNTQNLKIEIVGADENDLNKYCQ